jgi:hypothetical protein
VGLGLLLGLGDLDCWDVRTDSQVLVGLLRALQRDARSVGGFLVAGGGLVEH